MEKIIWTDRVRNELLLRMNEEMNILYTEKGIGHILGWNCLVSQGKIDVTWRRGGGRGQMDDLREKRMCWNLKE